MWPKKDAYVATNVTQRAHEQATTQRHGQGKAMSNYFLSSHGKTKWVKRFIPFFFRLPRNVAQSSQCHHQPHHHDKDGATRFLLTTWWQTDKTTISSLPLVFPFPVPWYNSDPQFLVTNKKRRTKEQQSPHNVITPFSSSLYTCDLIPVCPSTLSHKRLSQLLMLPNWCVLLMKGLSSELITPLAYFVIISSS